MIFVTTGTQEPFDRLLSIITEYSTKYKVDIVIQAKTDMKFPQQVKVFEFLSPNEFNYYFDKADLIVSHAGMGTIISALSKNKNILIIPRKASLGEHRNEHQLATARKINELGLVQVAFTEHDLLEKIINFNKIDLTSQISKIGPSANEELLNSIEQFILS